MGNGGEHHSAQSCGLGKKQKGDDEDGQKSQYTLKCAGGNREGGILHVFGPLQKLHLVVFHKVGEVEPVNDSSNGSRSLRRSVNCARQVSNCTYQLASERGQKESDHRHHRNRGREHHDSRGNSAMTSNELLNSTNSRREDNGKEARNSDPENNFERCDYDQR